MAWPWRRGAIAGLFRRTNEAAERWLVRAGGGLWDLLVRLGRGCEEHLPRPLLRLLRPPVQRLRAFCNRGDRVLRRCLVASGTVHVVGLIVLSIAWAAPRQIPWQQPPMMVSLVTLPEPEPPAPKETPAEKKPVPKPKPVPVKKDPPPPTQDAPVLKETKPKETKPQEPDPPPTQEPRETPEEKPKPDPPVAPPTPEPIAPVPTLDVSALVDEQFPFDYYLRQVQQMIAREWTPPEGLPRGAASPLATLRFRIDRQGLVSGIQVEEASVSLIYDRSAHEALLRAQPLPPLPATYQGRWLTVHLRFRIADSRPTGIR